MVTGPSFSISTSIIAPKMPCSTRCDPFSFEPFGVGVDQRRGDLRRRGFDEAGTASLARVGVKRELRNDQHAAAHLQRGAVHLARVVLEHPQICCLAGEQFRFGFGVAVRDADQRHETLIHRAGDAPLDGHAAPTHSL